MPSREDRLRNYYDDVKRFREVWWDNVNIPPSHKMERCTWDFEAAARDALKPLPIPPGVWCPVENVLCIFCSKFCCKMLDGEKPKEVTVTNQRLAENLRFWLKYFELGFPIDAQAKDSLTRDLVKCLAVVEDKAVGSAIDELERAIKAQEALGGVESSGGYDPVTRRTTGVIPKGARGSAANPQSPPVRHTGPVGECQDGPRKPSPYVWTDPDKTPVDSGQWTGRETTWDPGIPRRHPVDERHVDPTTANNIEQQERRVDRVVHANRPGRALT